MNFFPVIFKGDYDLGVGMYKTKLMKTGIEGFYVNNLKKEGNSNATILKTLMDVKYSN